MLKKCYKLLSILIVSGLLSSIAYAKSSAVILMYHHFGDDTPTSTSVTIKQFEAHLDYLEQNNFNVWPLSKLVQHWQSDQPIPERTVVLTADDAYKSVYTEAYPRLKKRDWSLTTFVNSEPIDKRFGNFMSWEQMREMQADGFEFANHSHTHSKMRPINNETKQQMLDRVRNELTVTQTRLKEELGEQTNQNPKLFAYPYGEYSESTANLIAEMGYVSVAQVSGAVDKHSDQRALNRFPMAVNFAELKDFALKVNTLPLPINQQNPKDPLISSNPPELTIKFNQPVKQLNCFNSLGQPLIMDWRSDTEVMIKSKQALNPPRDRYACTAPAGNGQWYWYGQLWIIDK